MNKLFLKLSNKMAKRLTIAFAVVAVLLAFFVLIFNSLTKNGYEVSTYSMGTHVQQTVYGSYAEETAELAANEIAKLEDLISWKIENSDIQRLNQEAGKNFIKINEDTYKLLDLSLAVSQMSGGAFDITIAPLNRLWNFNDEPQLPDESLIKTILENVDYKKLSLLEDNTAALQYSGMALDLDAIGNGAACDKAIACYESSKTPRAIVTVGTSVGVHGNKPFGEPWKIAVSNPLVNGSIGEVHIQSGFISTAGSYKESFSENGKIYHSILDSATGFPAETGLASVTVWSESGALSDALSNACFVLGIEKSQFLLKEFGAQAIFIDTDKNIYYTEGFTDKFILADDSFTILSVLQF